VGSHSQTGQLPNAAAIKVNTATIKEIRESSKNYYQPHKTPRQFFNSLHDAADSNGKGGQVGAKELGLISNSIKKGEELLPATTTQMERDKVNLILYRLYIAGIKIHLANNNHADALSYSEKCQNSAQALPKSPINDIRRASAAYLWATVTCFGAFKDDSGKAFDTTYLRALLSIDTVSKLPISRMRERLKAGLYEIAAVAQIQMKDPANALGLISEAIFLKYNNPDYYLLRASLHKPGDDKTLSDLDDAYHFASTRKEYKGNYALLSHILGQRALAYTYGKMPAEAQECERRAVELAGKLPENEMNQALSLFYLHFGAAKERMKDRKGALECFNKSQDYHQNPDALMVAARINFSNKDYRMALLCLNSILCMVEEGRKLNYPFGSLPDLYRLLAFTHQKLGGNPEKEREYLGKLISLVESKAMDKKARLYIASLHGYLGSLKSVSGNILESQPHMEAALKLLEGQPETAQLKELLVSCNVSLSLSRAFGDDVPGSIAASNKALEILGTMDETPFTKQMTAEAGVLSMLTNLREGLADKSEELNVHKILDPLILAMKVNPQKTGEIWSKAFGEAKR
jgi:tetratricopeptide (TPR) repeat protein